MSAADLPKVQFERLEDWHGWLSENHASAAGVWSITFKKGRGPFVPFGDMRDEALCWGWIDRQRRGVDEDRTSLLFGPRKAGSNWSDINKARITALTVSGRMQPPGLALVEAAKADGSWGV